MATSLNVFDLLATDDFTRADGDSMGSDWTEESGDTDIDTNRAKFTAASIASWAGTFDTDDADYIVEGVCEKTTTVGAVGIVGRFQDTNNFYLLEFNTFDQLAKLRKLVGGSNTTLDTYSGGYSNGTQYRLRLEMRGSHLLGYVDDVLRVEATDTSHTSAGVPGIRGDSSNGFVHEFNVYGFFDGTLIFKDYFVEASNTALESHTPDLGTSWTEIFSVGGGSIHVDATNDYITPDAGSFDDGAFYSCDATYPSANYQLISRIVDPTGSDDYTYLAVRMDGSGANGYYIKGMSQTASTDSDLMEIASGTESSLVFIDNGIGSGAVFQNNNYVLVQAYGDDIACFAGRSTEAQGEVAVAYAVDTTVSSANEAAVGMGAISSNGGDMGSQILDDVYVVALADNETDWTSPTTTGETNNDFTNPSNAYSSNNSDATTTTVGHKQDYGDFGFSTGSMGTIRGISVKLEMQNTSTSRWSRIGVEVSQDNGSTWSDQKLIEVETATDDEFIIGHARSLWGLTWTASNLADDSFRVRIEYVNEENTSPSFELDHVSVNVYYDDPAAAGGIRSMRQLVGHGQGTRD